MTRQVPYTTKVCVGAATAPLRGVVYHSGMAEAEVRLSPIFYPGHVVVQ